MNKLYPAYIVVEQTRCLVLGGGKTAWRKVVSLLECGARVTVISPEVVDELAELGRDGRITLHRREYRTGDVTPRYRIVIGATDNPDANRAIAAEAAASNVLCNIVDQPPLCSFYVPSSLQRGDLKIAISTNGKSPALARKIRLEMEREYGHEYTRFLKDLGRIRRKLIAEIPNDQQRRRELLTGIVNSPALQLLKQNDIKAYQRELDKWNCCS